MAAGLLCRLGDAAQRLVDHVMPIALTVSFQVVHTDEQQAHGCPGAKPSSPFARECFFEAGYVGQARDAVLGGVALELVGQPFDAQLGLHPRQHQRLVHRFGDEIHRAERQPLDLEVVIRVAGHKNDGHIAQHRIGLHGLADLKTAHARQLGVQDHQVGLPVARLLQGRLAGGGETELAQSGEHASHHPDQARIVVHQQDVVFHALCSFFWPTPTAHLLHVPMSAVGLKA